MSKTRIDFEKEEKGILALYAVKSDDPEATKREVEEVISDDRTHFQHDRNLIKYCLSFDRLGGKTQVLSAGHGDHFKNRLLHTEYVADFARSLEEALNADVEGKVDLSDYTWDKYFETVYGAVIEAIDR